MTLQQQHLPDPGTGHRPSGWSAGAPREGRGVGTRHFGHICTVFDFIDACAGTP